MLTVYLLRHGETVWNADGNRYCGATDIGLTDRGIQQAHSVVNVLKDVSFDAIYSSPLQRAFRTAQIASGKLAEDIIIDGRLTEANFGEWEGKTREEFIADKPELWANWCQDPGQTRAGGDGETATEVIDRVADFFGEAQRKYPSGTILVVAHNAVNRFYMAWKLGVPLSNYRKLTQENASVTVFSLDADGEFSLLKLNCR